MVTISVEGQEVKFAGDLTIHILEGLMKKLDEIIDKAKKDITINFKKVTSIDCASLQLLLAFKKSIEKKVSVKIINIHPNVARVFKISGLEREFK